MPYSSFLTKVEKDLSLGDQITNLGSYIASKPNGFTVRVSWKNGDGSFKHTFVSNYTIGDIPASSWNGSVEGFVILELDHDNGDWVVLCAPESLLAPVGSIEIYSGGLIPDGYLLCDGASYNTADYPVLFANIGYTFGGSGSSFNVLDSRGASPYGAGDGYAIGQKVNDQVGDHTHFISGTSGIPNVPHRHGVWTSGENQLGGYYYGREATDFSSGNYYADFIFSNGYSQPSSNGSVIITGGFTSTTSHIHNGITIYTNESIGFPTTNPKVLAANFVIKTF